MKYKKDENKIKEREETISEIRNKFILLKPHLNERMIRLFAASEALSLGYKGIQIVSEATGLSRITITNGCDELQNTDIADQERIRRTGAGRKSTEIHTPELFVALKDLVETTTFGNPETPLQWTCKSQRNLADELCQQGYQVSHTTVGVLLEKLGYSLQTNKKSYEGNQNEDRNAQFEYINNKVIQFIDKKQPVISVDTKKKELVGNYKNNGRTYRPIKDPLLVKMHDFEDKELGKVNPYGVYDIGENIGWINLGIDHDTAEFAVESIRRWFYKIGRPIYPKCDSILITADGGGSNGSRVKLWKTELYKLSLEIGCEIHVSHFPPGTSKWNKIEHRLFSYISQNWQGQPLISHEVIIQLISSTTTSTGLKVFCEIDNGVYKKGIKITDEQLEDVPLSRAEFHGEWNYIINKNHE